MDLASLFAGAVAYWHVPSIAITFGGTIAATLIQHRTSEVVETFRACREALRGRSLRPRAEIDRFLRFASRVRREGLLAIEPEALRVADPFLRKGLRLVLDGLPRQTIREILEIEKARREDASAAAKSVLEAMATYAPAFGMIGTLVGLVRMLSTFDDPGALGGGMSTALLTTLYGALAANLVFLPLAGKLEARHREETEIRELMIEGLMSLEAREAPLIVEERLSSFLEPAQRRAIAEGVA